MFKGDTMKSDVINVLCLAGLFMVAAIGAVLPIGLGLVAWGFALYTGHRLLKSAQEDAAEEVEDLYRQQRAERVIARVKE
jgi:hypothetical protein